MVESDVEDFQNSQAKILASVKDSQSDLNNLSEMFIRLHVFQSGQTKFVSNKSE